jgi:hypothetical protein
VKKIGKVKGKREEFYPPRQRREEEFKPASQIEAGRLPLVKPSCPLFP